MKANKILILLIISTFTLTGVANAQQEYKIEQGKIAYKMIIMGMEMDVNIYFKRYGKLQTVETNMEMMGAKTENRAIIKDGYLYSLDMIQKKGFKQKIKETDSLDIQKIDFDNIPAEYIEKYNIKEIGKEVVAGKNCKKISITDKGNTNTMCIWKNIPLRYTVTQQGMAMEMKAVEVNENPDFPSGIFDIPADFEVEEKEL